MLGWARRPPPTGSRQGGFPATTHCLLPTVFDLHGGGSVQRGKDVGLSHWLIVQTGRPRLPPALQSGTLGGQVGLSPELQAAAACVILAPEPRPSCEASSRGQKSVGSRCRGLCPGFVASMGFTAVLSGLLLLSLLGGHASGRMSLSGMKSGCVPGGLCWVWRVGAPVFRCTLKASDPMWV